MIVRRSAALLAATAVIGTVCAPAALADESPSVSPSASASQAFPSGLFGSTDPTYDGVWRQSLALLAQHTVGVKPAAKAVDWLTGQSCANGAFAPYRADASARCGAKTMVDTNSTAAAVQALEALGGHDSVTSAAVKWLKSVQNEDGGWGYAPGGASDTNSTSVVIGALEAADIDPDDVPSKDEKTPYDALLALSVPCDEDGGGAFAFQPDKKGRLAANADATTAGLLGSLGKGLVTQAGDKAGDDASKGSKCEGGDSFTRQDAAANGAAYLTGALAKNGYLKSALAGAEDQPDHGNTADAVVALAAAGRTSEAGKPLAWLEKNSGTWAAKSGPAAYAQLIFAAHATGTDPRDFGGADLVKQLGATGPAGQASDASAGPADKGDKGDKTKQNDDEDGGVSLWWIIGVGLVGGIGVGFLISGRNKKQQP
ncbi:prenyltransferase/squalene oxidase repeat-containing protein [Streptomyces sporangiiformans]|uniref:Terpene cyclase/mutase family protein n=1 Tax=Streptomyces sporangiiformans TaxID=2315329 RepID=A0A505D7Y9_9ACTN|nr:prenyltransferase/squalene oxidase repeat-containing protein [Streptomyces sporangiiformans]TPQ17885.1 terpene cyclase/mutase family protein [Streptomyces sporangiiformans]